MRSKTKTNSDVGARIFPRLVPVTYNCSSFWLADCTVSVCCGFTPRNWKQRGKLNRIPVHWKHNIGQLTSFRSLLKWYNIVQITECNFCAQTHYVTLVYTNRAREAFSTTSHFHVHFTLLVLITTHPCTRWEGPRIYKEFFKTNTSSKNW